MKIFKAKLALDGDSVDQSRLMQTGLYSDQFWKLAGFSNKDLNQSKIFAHNGNQYSKVSIHEDQSKS